MALTVHKWYANKACPGTWFCLRIPNFVDEVNKRLSGEEKKDEPADWARDAMRWAVKTGLSDGTRPKDACTRQEVITLLYRLFGKDEKDGRE